ncbi:MAG: cadmium-translocating P-type ATPase [Gammaproteobacteria bacterium]|nr:cadmium-translocating P-type ATPase [Gammaproteobacteria bacterium]
MMQLKIAGLRCNGCANKIEKKLNALAGINASVSFVQERLMLTLDNEPLFIPAYQLIRDHDYELADISVSFQVNGWTCAGCANKTIKALKQLIGVVDAVANVTAQTLTISYIDGAIKPIKFIETVQQLGYEMNVMVDNQQELSQALALKHQQQNQFELRQLIISCLFTLPLVLPMLVMLFGFTLQLNPWVELGLASVVQFVVGYKFYRGAWVALKNRSSNMDTLVVLGTSAAYLYSCYLLFSLGSAAQGTLYFEASAVVITFISIGKWLERQAKFKTGQVIRELMALRPIEARVLRHQQTKMLPLEQVVLGDRVKIHAGEKIPADGVIVAGASELDESLVTGESLPITKSVDDSVIAGSVNGHGVLTVEVTALGADSSISQIIKLVESAQMTKAPIERLVDKISGYFVPAVLVIALATGLIWLWLGAGFEVALINSVAVLVVACPCALGLATPAAIVVGSGVGAEHGIIIRDPKALEVAAKLSLVAFDKTGTLTVGQPSIDHIKIIAPYEPALLSSLMQQSEHPLAQAIVRHGVEKNHSSLTIDNFKVLAGKGVTATYQQQHLAAGNLELMQSLNITGIEAYQQQSDYSEIYFSVDHQLYSIVFLEDAIRAQSQQAISSLQQTNIDVAMLSGDHGAAANKVASSLGITKVYSRLKPQDKLQQLLDWQNQGLKVAMVGDGINDAPALAQADLGIAMGSGTQVAIASADITLVRDNPLLVAAAIDLAQVTWLKIKQNLFLAFIFNGLAIPLAAAGALSPQLAGLAMALSSVTVLSNALLLKRWKIKEA